MLTHIQPHEQRVIHKDCGKNPVLYRQDVYEGVSPFCASMDRATPTKGLAEVDPHLAVYLLAKPRPRPLPERPLPIERAEISAGCQNPYPRVCPSKVSVPLHQVHPGRQRQRRQRPEIQTFVWSRLPVRARSRQVVASPEARWAVRLLLVHHNPRGTPQQVGFGGKQHSRLWALP